MDISFKQREGLVLFACLYQSVLANSNQSVYTECFEELRILHTTPQGPSTCLFRKKSKKLSIHLKRN